MPAALPKKLLWAQALVAFLGFLDATYLTAEHYLGLSIPCFTGVGCDVVTHTAYASIGPIPISLLGALYSLGFFLASLFLIGRYDPRLSRQLSYASWAGFGVSLVLVSLQLFVIHAICVYCMGSALSSTMLWVLGMYGLWVLRKSEIPKGEM